MCCCMLHAQEGVGGDFGTRQASGMIGLGGRSYVMVGIRYQVVLPEDSVLGRLGFWLCYCIWRAGVCHQLASPATTAARRRRAAARTCDLTQVEGDREEQASRVLQGTQGTQGPDGRRVWALEGGPARAGGSAEA